MIKQGVHKVLSVLMALLVLFSTISFTIDKHYCGSTLVDVAIFHKAKTCGMEMQQSTANRECAVTKNNCCKEEQIVIQGQDELKFSTIEDLNLDQQIFAATFVYTYSNLFESLPKKIIPFKDYSPPNLITDIQVLDQVFII